MLNRVRVTCVLTLALLSYAIPAFAQPREEWELLLEHSKPQLFIYEDKLGKATHYWYFTFKMTNMSKHTVYTLVDITLLTTHGKSLQADITKKDPYFPFTGYYHTSVVHPDAEHAIIVKDRKLGALNPQLQRESIAAFKDLPIEEYGLSGAYNDKNPDGSFRAVPFQDKNASPMYLNTRELRYYTGVRGVKAGQTIGGIAVFSGVDPFTQALEVQISGLRNVIFIEKVEDKHLEAAYKNDIFKIMYEFPGDWNDRQKDMVLFKGRRWVTKQIGPIAHKETLEFLVHLLVDSLRDYKAGTKPKKEIDLLDLDIAYHVFSRALGREDFGIVPWKYGENGFNSFKEYFERNEKALWKIHEYWVRYKHMLHYDDKIKRYREVRRPEDIPLPEGYKPPEPPKVEEQPQQPGGEQQQPGGEQKPPEQPQGGEQKPPEGGEQKPPEGGEQKQPE